MITTDNDGAPAPAADAPRPTTLTIELRTPIETIVDRLPLSRIDVREPRVCDLLVAGGVEEARSSAILVAAAASLTPLDIDRLAISDFRKAEAFVDDFFVNDAPPVEGPPAPTLTVALREPVQANVGGEVCRCEAFTLREPTVAEWRSIRRHDGVERDVEAFKLLADLPRELIAQFPVSDFMRGARYLAGFFA